MLIKEYRIPLPLSVEEYRIAQLYMIAKKSREESKGADSGVEILVNEPYEGGPGGDGNTSGGQYTRKIYHVGSHLPGWFKGLLPKSALSVEEEAWNAYPYTKTRYTCPFVEKFSLEIETYYYPDNGSHDNVFKMSQSEVRNVSVDIIDIVKDQLYGADYIKEEDPRSYVSEKTGRGPLSENWISEYWKECQNKNLPTSSGKSIMCAYKLCKVEFRYWGMQTKIEKFIHEVALRKTMVRAHRQAWAWQDEWVNLTMDDIRQIERQTQEALKRKMGSNSNNSEECEGNDTVDEQKNSTSLAATMGSIEKSDLEVATPVTSKRMHDPTLYSTATCVSSSSDTISSSVQPSSSSMRIPVKKNWNNSKSQVPSPGSTQSFDTGTNHWRMESLVRDSDSDLSNDDEFFDCQETLPTSEIVSLSKWSSLTILNEQEFDSSSIPEKEEDSIFSPTYKKSSPFIQRGHSVDTCPGSPVASKETNCQISTLLMIIHSGSVLDANSDIMAKKSDFTTFRGAFESVMRQHYPSMIGHVAMRLIPCPSICAEGLSVLSKLSPYSFAVSPSAMEGTNITHDSIPIGAIPILAGCSHDYKDMVSNVIRMGNQTYRDFIKSDEGFGFNGRVYLIGDSMGSVIGYDALCRSPDSHSHEASRHSTPEHLQKKSDNDDCTSVASMDSSFKVLVTPPVRRRSSSTSDSNVCLDFEVSEMFMFASPLSLVLAFRKISAHKYDKSTSIKRPALQQVYNLFHPSDPIASRLEPLISAKFSTVPPVNIPQYQKYPLGTGQPYYLLETVQTHPQLFTDQNHGRRTSETSILSTVSGIGDTLPIQAINKLTKKWWGTKRLDYALYCPEGLSNFPTNALPHIFHASYWESSDVIAFILRQFAVFDYSSPIGNDEKELASFSPSQPREKWQRKTTFIKIKNSTASHRANDVIIREGLSQTISARFIYGPFDMFSLAGEKVDIHIIRESGNGEWTHETTEDSDKNGRVIYTIPEDKSLGCGIYPVKMVVRGDHTSVDFLLAIVPPQTEMVVFSIDGSFSASVSVTGRDPKVRAGAVDIVRHWQDLGYLIVYITGRPDMQQQRVLSWLSQHNFPHGLVSFADGLSTDFLAHKITYLKSLVQDHKMIIHAAYGSSKDISVYSALDLKPKQIFIIGKVGRKHHAMATVLSDGYAVHLSALQCHGGSRPAQGNARMLLTSRGRFGHNASMRRRRSAKRTTSFPICSLTRSTSRSRYDNL